MSQKNKITYYGSLILFFIIIFSATAIGESTKGAFAFMGFANGAGTRAMGMNGAYTSIADDSTGAYWNPAGITTAASKELSFAYADLYDLGLIANHTLNMSAPETKTSKGALALGWNRLQFDFDSWTEETFICSYGKTVYASKGKGQESGISLSCGATAKYLRQTSKLPIKPEENQNATWNSRGIGLDIGILARMVAKDGRNLLRLGIAAQDVPSIIEWNSDKKEYMPYRYTLACSTQPLPRFTVAVDVVSEKAAMFNEVHLGMEHWIFNNDNSNNISEKNLAVRGGIARELKDSSRTTYSCGVGIRWSSWQLDYAYLMDNNGIGDTKGRFSLSVRF